MMGFITAITSINCEICNKKFMSGETGRTRPYDDYSCSSCNWNGTICSSCANSKCPKCNNEIKSTHEKSGLNALY